MGKFTGTPSTGRLKKFGAALLDGLDAMATAANDAPKRSRILEIDNTILELQQERDHMIQGLVEKGDYVVSENYNPNWSKKSEPIAPVVAGEGRLTKCKGRWSETSTMHDAHPGCPYINTKHIAHEFTLKD